jgi:hypothetical protein
MVEIYNERRVKKTRAGHICEICLRKIPKGFSATFHTGKADGEFFRYYTCNTCTKLSNGFADTCIDPEDLYVDSQRLYDTMSEYNCHTPLQLLHKLEKDVRNKKAKGE